MRPKPDDRAHLWDMLNYARETVESLRGIIYDRYVENRNLTLATERRIEIVGEAARRVSHEFQEGHPEIPWRKVITMRHVLAHEYGEIKQEVVYRVVAVHLPEMIKALEAISFYSDTHYVSGEEVHVGDVVRKWNGKEWVEGARVEFIISTGEGIHPGDLPYWRGVSECGIMFVGPPMGRVLEEANEDTEFVRRGE